MTKQETFDIVAKHLLDQGEKSKHFDDCYYRGPNGLKCAAGILIPDEKYREEFEDTPVLYSCNDASSTSDVGKVLKKLGHDIFLVDRLQKIHDTKEPKQWHEELCELAEEFGLVFNLENFK